MKIKLNKTPLPDPQPEFLQGKGFEAWRFDNPDGGEPITFIVVKKDREPNLPRFVGPCEKFFFISEEVPEEFRAYFVYHEYLEFNVFKEEMGRCLASLQRELELVPENIKADYIVYRADFFEGLIKYFSDPQRGATPEFMQEIRASLKELQEYCG